MTNAPKYCKPKRKMRRNEAPLHDAIWRLLRLRGVLAYTFFNGPIYIQAWKKYKKNTPDRPAGIPDIICKIKNGPSFWIEVKTPDGSVSRDQKIRHAEIKEWGWPVFVCRSVIEVDSILEEVSRDTIKERGDE